MEKKQRWEREREKCSKHAAAEKICTTVAAAACLLHFSISLYFFHLCFFSTKNRLAKLKGLLRVQPNGRRKDEPQRGFISVRSWSLSTLGSKHACDKNRRSSVTYASISVFPPHPIPSSRITNYVVCCSCLHIKSHPDLYSVPSNIRIGPTDANTFRGHRLTTQKGYTCAAYKIRNIFLK